MRVQVALLTVAVALSSLLLVTTSAVADLREPEGTAALAATLAEDPNVREAVAEALVSALLADTAERGVIASGFIPLIRPLLDQAAREAIDSPAGRAALTSALTEALRQLTFRGPIVVDLRAAVLVAADTAPPPLDTLARAAVENGSVGVVVIGAERAGPLGSPPRPPDDDELRRVAGLPADVAVVLVGLLIAALLAAIAGRDGAARPRRLMIAGTPLLVVGAGSLALLRLAPGMVVDRLTPAALDDRGQAADVLPLLADGMVQLLASTATLSAALAMVGVALAVAGGIVVAGRRRRP